MKKLIAVSIVLISSVCSTRGGLALEANTADTASSSPSSASYSAKDKALAVPKTMAGVFAGLTVGIPVKIVKDIKHETRRMAGTARNDMGNEFGLIENLFVAGAAIPYGLVSGTITGSIRGTERAITYGTKAPFCKESLGLKEPPKAEPIADDGTARPAAIGQR